MVGKLKKSKAHKNFKQTNKTNKQKTTTLAWNNTRHIAASYFDMPFYQQVFYCDC